jgi:hypothetical protein
MACNEEKLKASLGDGVPKIEEVVRDGLAWLDENRDAQKELIEEKQKSWESVINPLMSAAAGGGSAPAADGETGPKVEEVD